MRRRLILIVISVILLILLFHPGRHAKYYNYVSKSNVFHELLPRSIGYEQINGFCSKRFYINRIMNGLEFEREDIYKLNGFVSPKLGGEYFPSDCKAMFESAVIVPYRNRTEQLKLFLSYMHTFLQQQRIHYKIIVVDQQDALPFNRALLLNIGAAEAIRMNFSCLILHDVDLFPLSLKNLYACSRKPRHMSSSIDTLRYNLPYLGLSGGAFAIQSQQFQKINGMSNEFYGWGGEDDDFFSRLEKGGLLPYRFPPEISKYTMLFHKKEKASKERYGKLQDSDKRQYVDGLNSLQQSYRVFAESLFTHIIVT